MVHAVCTTTMNGWRVEAWEGDTIQAELDAIIEPIHNSVILHHKIHSRCLSMLKFCLESFVFIRAGVKGAGYQYLVTCADKPTATMMHYWRLMGFKVWYEFETLQCAIMEA